MEKLMNSTLKEFCYSVGSDSFAPGGGCVSALAASLAASLGKMVLLLTIGKKKYAEFDPENKGILQTLTKSQTDLMKCVDRDLEGCNWILTAMAYPKDTEPERIRRKTAISDAAKKANEAPVMVCEGALNLLLVFKKNLSKINRNTLTDWACGAMQAYAALEGAAMNAKINCGSIDDPRYCKELQARLRQILGEGRAHIEQIRNQVHSSLDSSN